MAGRVEHQANKIQVQYDNDTVINGQDRNPVVNKIAINGHAVSPTASNVSYDRGTLDGKDVIKGQSDMWWNGTLVANVDKSVFAAAPVVGHDAAHMPEHADAHAMAFANDGHFDRHTDLSHLAA